MRLLRKLRNKYRKFLVWCGLRPAPVVGITRAQLLKELLPGLNALYGGLDYKKDGEDDA
jgi:hypothetical protein